MSFKKKTVVISGSASAQRPITGGVLNRGAPVRGGPGGPVRGGPPSAVPIRSPIPIASTPDIQNHEGIKPSLQTSAWSISTGSASLDKLLTHGGLPLGSTLAIEESGSTDFASIILRSFASQGIVHARLAAKSAPTKIIVIGADESWGNELPGVYKDKKEAAKELIRKEENKISVGNLANEGAPNMKIAWRYSQGKANEASTLSDSKPNYTSQFDFNSRLIPRPSSNEIIYIPVKNTLSLIISQLEIIIKQAIETSTIVRIVIPSLLHPAIYPPHLANPNELIPFIHSLRTLARKYPKTVAIVLSLPLQLFPRDTALIRWFELLNDGVLHLEPFPEEIINELKEANANDISSSSTKSKSSSTTTPNQSQGLVHIYKLPLSSEKGIMAVRKSEHAFRVGRRQFEVQEWGIPVEDGPESEDKKLDY